MPESTMNVSDILRFVLERADETDLDRLARAIRSRHRTLKEKAAAGVTEGVKVRLDGINPKYLAGLTGTVKSISPSGRTRRAVITLDKQSSSALALATEKYRFLIGKDSYDLTGIPVTCCQVTGS